MVKINLTEQEMVQLFDRMISLIYHDHPEGFKDGTTIYGIPRGGVPVAYRLAGMLGFTVVDSPDAADIIVDDLVCTGKTRDNIAKKAKRSMRFYSLINTQNNKIEPLRWYVFPWEGNLVSSAEDIPIRLIEFIGEDPQRDGLLGTPERFLKTWQFFTKGYKDNPKTILETKFQNEENYNEMVVLRDLEFYSVCEHHMVPFFGKVHVAYIPNTKVVGISKIARLVECFSRRLQIQERLTEQIANAIEGNLKPKGVAVLIEAKHLCMVARGVEKQNSVMVTSALKGALEEQGARMEFLFIKR